MDDSDEEPPKTKTRVDEEPPKTDTRLDVAPPKDDSSDEDEDYPEEKLTEEEAQLQISPAMRTSRTVSPQGEDGRGEIEVFWRDGDRWERDPDGKEYIIEEPEHGPLDERTTRMLDAMEKRKAAN